MPLYQNSFPRKESEFCYYFSRHFFLIKILQLTCHLSTLVSTLCEKTIKHVSKSSQITQNPGFVNLENVTYIQPIWVALNLTVFRSVGYVCLNWNRFCLFVCLFVCLFFCFFFVCFFQNISNDGRVIARNCQTESFSQLL